MNFANPTRLRLGLHARFEGKDYRIVGRAVLGEQEGDETYYWNEFYLVATTGEQATLVYDESERTSQWRLFSQFEAEHPMSVAEAASKQVGDPLNLTGDEVRVTFRGTSQTYFIEGTAPAGGIVGDVAEYFNAQSGTLMQVVSWTEEKVEYYYGLNLTRAMVAAAFDLPMETGGAGERENSAFESSGEDDEADTSNQWKVGLWIGIIVVAVFLFAGKGCSVPASREAAPIAKIAAGVSPLSLGDAGAFFGTNYHVTAHARVEIAQVGARWERHEYDLTDDSGATVRLVCGLQSPRGDWALMEPFQPDAAPSPEAAATKKVGDPVELNGYTGKVDDVFLSTLESSEGPEGPGNKNGAVSYGFRGSNEYRQLLVQWDAAGIQFFRGRTMTAQQGMAAFTAGKPSRTDQK